MKVTTLTAQVYKISTTPDGGYRLQFDVGENDREQVKALMDHMSGLVQLGIVPLGEQQAAVPSEIEYEDFDGG